MKEYVKRNQQSNNLERQKVNKKMQERNQKKLVKYYQMVKNNLMDNLMELTPFILRIFQIIMMIMSYVAFSVC